MPRVRKLQTKIVLSCLLMVIVFSAALPSLIGSAYAPSYTSSFSSIQPAPTLSVQPQSPSIQCINGALCPSMLRNAYGFDILQKAGTTGKDQTVVIVDACGDSTIKSDLRTFDSQFGLSDPKLTIQEPEGKPVPSCTGWDVETALDVEWAHVVAPGAAIDLIVTANAGAQAMYLAWSYALKNNLGNQISDSWGGAGCGVKPCNNTLGEGIGPCTLTNGTQGVNVGNILSTAKSKHVTVLAASGDGGAWGYGTSAEEPVPGGCQGVLTVGGTLLTVTNSGAYKSEYGWSGSGGGYVTAPKEPSYQVTAQIKDPYKLLAKPDVSAIGGTNVWVFDASSGGWITVTGTSLATPLWAGFMADVNQIRAQNNYSPAGFVNAFLYSVIYTNKTLYKSDFHDVSGGNNGWAGAKGWDPVTGLGSFVAQNLAETLGNEPNA